MEAELIKFKARKEVSFNLLVVGRTTNYEQGHSNRPEECQKNQPKQIKQLELK